MTCHLAKTIMLKCMMQHRNDSVWAVGLRTISADCVVFIYQIVVLLCCPFYAYPEQLNFSWRREVQWSFLSGMVWKGQLLGKVKRVMDMSQTV